MRLSLLVSLSLLLLLSWQTACAQLPPADDFFHSGAQLYISNNIPQAEEMVKMGLKLYPDDIKLKKLDELLKQQSQSSQSQQNQQNQSQQNQSQQQQSQNNQQSQQQDQQSSQRNSPDQQKQNEQNQSGQKKDEPEKQPEQQKASAGKQDKQDGEGQPVSSGQMTPEEAKRLLDAQKGSEQVLQLKPQGKPENQNRSIKDW
jgi:hypothetical protein